MGLRLRLSSHERGFIVDHGSIFAGVAEIVSRGRLHARPIVVEVVFAEVHALERTEVLVALWHGLVHGLRPEALRALGDR